MCVRLFATLWTVACLLCPWDFPGKNTWSGLPFPTPGDFPNPGIKPMSLASPVLAGGIFITEAPVKFTIYCQILLSTNLCFYSTGVDANSLCFTFQP